MLRWSIYALVNMLCLLVCYVTNPIVCLLCDEEGELHGVLHYWQTWDDSCNPRFFVMEKVPAFLCYDYDRHYVEYWSDEPCGRARCYAALVDGHFTMAERIKRYVCRVLWLTRNCGYGFAYYCFGVDIDPLTMTFHHPKDGITVGTNGDVWMYKNDAQIFGNLHWKLFFGWKVGEGDRLPMRAMIANRIAFSV